MNESSINSIIATSHYEWRIVANIISTKEASKIESMKSYKGGIGVSSALSEKSMSPFCPGCLSSKFNGGILSVGLGLTCPNLNKENH